MLTIDSTAVQNLTFDTVRKFLLRHEKEFGRLDKLQRYYLGKHDVLNRKRKAVFRTTRLCATMQKRFRTRQRAILSVIRLHTQESSSEN